MAWLKKNWRLTLVICLALANLAVWSVVGHSSDRRLIVAFLNVGQGDATYIETPSGRQILIDGGPGSAVLRELGTVIPWYDRSIDLLVLTHPHADHLDGLISVLDRYQVGAIIESGVEYPTADYAKWRELIAVKKTKTIVAARGERVDLGDGVTLEVLAPLANWTGRAPQNVHDAMVVTKLTYASTSVLFTGDMEKSLEAALLGLDGVAAGGELDSDLLKVGHHGSQTSTGAPFVSAVTPAAAIISVGAGNRYRLPFPGTLEELEDDKIPTWRTDEVGRLVWASDGANFTWQRE